MHLIITSYQRLSGIYGQATLEQLRYSIADLAKARDERGLMTTVVALEDGWPELEVAGIDSLEPQAVRQQVLLIAAALAQRDARLESLLIVGGHEIVPFISCPNPFTESSELFSDYGYGVSEFNELLMAWPVGRLPGLPTRPGPLVRLLSLAARMQRQPPLRPAQPFGYSAALWGPAAQAVFAALPTGPQLLISPPADANTLDLALLDRAHPIYLNLHGVRDGLFWYGQAAQRPGRMVLALRPVDLEQVRLAGAAVISEACYGATIASDGLSESFALRFLLQGAACFVGATAITYGPLAPPLSDADLLAYHLLQRFMQPGATAGAALQEARQLTLRDTIQAQGFIDEDIARTLIQFVLYGDPTLVVGGR